jgi:hypothetical protein
VLVAACGRLRFDELADAPGFEAPDVATRPVEWRGVFVERDNRTGNASDTFTATALAAGDAIALHVSCDLTATAPTVTVTAPGWTFAPIAPITGSASLQFWVASFGAIAPDTAPAAVTVQWSASCTQNIIELGDEFSAADPAGGTTTFDAHGERVGAGNCTTSLSTGHDGDTLWAACASFLASQVVTLTDIGPGFTKSGDDQMGDWSEYRITSDPAGTQESATFDNTAGANFAITAVAIKPAP